MKNKQRNHDEDTEAILNRRRFLIKSTLAGAGLSAVLAGCEDDPKPQPCLQVTPPKTKPKPPESQPCLSVEIGGPTTQPKPPEPDPELCLSIP